MLLPIDARPGFESRPPPRAGPPYNVVREAADHIVILNKLFNKNPRPRWAEKKCLVNLSLLLGASDF